MNLVVDLGTSNFRTAAVGRETILSEPSVLARDGKSDPIIGIEAQRMIGRNPKVIEIVTPIDAGVVRNLEAVVEIIKHCAKRFAPKHFVRKYSLTLSIPSGLTQVELRAMEDAGRLAGARHVQLVNATVAAAFGAGLPVDSPTGCLVVNLGGGVTEATVLSMNGIVASHRIGIGGQAIDKAIVERAKKEYAFLLGLRSAEELKHRLCTEDIRELEVRGRNLRTGLPDRLLVSRSLAEEQIASYSETIVDLIVKAISECPPELVGDIIDRGIVLVGGGANIPGVLSSLTSRLNAPVIVPDAPETCVIRGLLQVQWDRKRQSLPSESNRMSPVRGVKQVVGQYKSIMRRGTQRGDDFTQR